jgi:CRISPR type III-A-associated protein Csm2
MLKMIQTNNPRAATQRSGRQQEDCNEELEALRKEKLQIYNFLNCERPDELLNAIQNYVNCIAKTKSVTTHQLRNLYDLVRDKKVDTWQSLHRLRPKFAYAQARMSNAKGKEFIGFLEALMAGIKDDEGNKVKNFKHFFEAVVAYHKYEDSISNQKTVKNEP